MKTVEEIKEKIVQFQDKILEVVLDKNEFTSPSISEARTAILILDWVLEDNKDVENE